MSAALGSARLAIAAAALAAALVGQFARAEEAMIPTPRAVIYPGDVITDLALTDMNAADAAANDVVVDRSQAVGKVAKLTLLPGRPIPFSALDNPRLVRNGAEVRLVFVDGGLEITASGSALQDGGLGEVVKVRNNDSGVTVSGAVQQNGSVLIDGGR